VDISYSGTTIKKKKRTLDARDAERNSKPDEEETKVRTPDVSRRQPCTKRRGEREAWERRGKGERGK
jgi:hypothetical protein